ncbi:nitrogen fixation protein NifR, partial [Staphylococcus aureus]|nr:nitrogen fixation protein NifR [Staphylococcus aureus]
RKCACNKLFSILVRGPNTENFEKKFYRQCELGWWPQHREIGFPISTDNASRRGPNTEAVTMIKYYYIINH